MSEWKLKVYFGAWRVYLKWMVETVCVECGNEKSAWKGVVDLHVSSVEDVDCSQYWLVVGKGMED